MTKFKKILIYSLFITISLTGVFLSVSQSSMAANNGKLSVCVLVVDETNHLIRDFSDLPGSEVTFTVPITVHNDGVAKVIKNAVFSTKSFKPNTKIVGLANDAQCITYNLPISDYYYRREQIDGPGKENFLPAFYSDEHSKKVSVLADFSAMDIDNENSDGTVVLHDDESERRVVVLNFYKKPAPVVEPIVASCFASSASAFVGDTVNWRASVSGGTGTFEYEWSEAATGTKRNVSSVYTTAGTKTAKVAVTYGNKTVNRECSINIEQIPVDSGTLKIINHVSNTHGGNKQPSDFKLFVNNTEVENNVEKTLSPGAYTVSVENMVGYEAGDWSGDCSADGHVTLAAGDRKTCEVTNHDIEGAPVFGCIAITKKAYDSNGVLMPRTPSFIFTLDGNQTYAANNASGTVEIQNVSVGNHILAEVVPEGWIQTSVEPFLQNGHITVNGGENCFPVTFSNKKIGSQPIELSASCVASKNPIVLNEVVHFTATPAGGTGAYSYSWSDGLSGATSTNGIAYSATGTKTASVTVTSGDQSTTTNCSVLVKTQDNNGGGGGGGSNPNLALSCAANKSSVLVGEIVTFTATSTGGNGSYIYSWAGENIATNTTAIATTSYSTIGTKTATITATSSNQTMSSQCSVSVVTETVVQPPTGCTSSSCTSAGGSSGVAPQSGGGTVGPIVTAPATTTPTGEVAGVFLSQVPYTGVGSTLKVISFMMALFLWSAWIAYIIIKRRTRLAVVGISSAARASSEVVPKFDPRLDVLRKETDELVMTLEARAREHRALVSVDGLHSIIESSNQNKHTAMMKLDYIISKYSVGRDNVEKDWTTVNVEQIKSSL